MCRKTGRWVVVIACLTFWRAGLLAQSSSWEALNESGVKAYEQGRYTEAEKQLKAAIRAAQVSKSQDQHLAPSLNNLAALYHAQDKYNKAEQLYRKSLSIAEKSLGGEHPFVVKVLTNINRCSAS